jgi:hypothetical protein
VTDEELQQTLRSAAQPHWKVKGNSVTVRLPDGRSQTVHLMLSADSIQLESPVAPVDNFESPMDATTFLTMQHEGLVAMYLRIVDGNIMARKELPFSGFTKMELQVGIHDLAVEADRIEWLATGLDKG